MYYSLLCWLMGNLTLCCSLKRCSSLIFSASSFPFFISIWASLSFRTSVRSRAPCKVQMTSGKKILWYNKWWIQGRAPPAFWTKLRPEGPKKFLLETGPLLSQGLDDSPRPPLPPNNSECLGPSLIMQYMYVIRMSSIYIVTAFL